jgi:hypothetical protein
MTEYDLILDGNQTPTFEAITGYISGHAALLWQEFNSFVQETFRSSPKITFSVCSGKPGWNVKYQKSGKSICTIYPERDSFVVLVVVTIDLLPVVESMEPAPPVHEIIRTAKPFNRTLWLMIPVAEQAVLESVKELLVLKHSAGRG